MSNELVTYRKGNVEDSYAAFLVVEEALADLSRRMGNNKASITDDSQQLAKMWDDRREMYDHLARNAAGFWLAEKDGQVVGLARSLLRDGLWELTELFVTPVAQSSGVGRGLLDRISHSGQVERRIIISSPDLRAQHLYETLGLSPFSSLYYLWRKPELVAVEGNLGVVPAENTAEHLDIIGKVDKVVLGHRRDSDHQFLLKDRQGYLFIRDGLIAGYGYMGQRNGPFALLDAADYPAVLSFAENSAASNGFSKFSVQVPDLNTAALAYLSRRGFVRDEFVPRLMSDGPMGSLDKYIVTSPPFIL